MVQPRHAECTAAPLDFEAQIASGGVSWSSEISYDGHRMPSLNARHC